MLNSILIYAFEIQIIRVRSGSTYNLLVIANLILKKKTKAIPCAILLNEKFK